MPLSRRSLLTVAPTVVLMLTAGAWLTDSKSREIILKHVDEIVMKYENRDAFQIREMHIEGASPLVESSIKLMMPVNLPISSFDIDLEGMQELVLSIDAVAGIDISVEDRGILSAVVTERQPALLWRQSSGLQIIDATGHAILKVAARDQRPDLPVIVGESANTAAGEALAILKVADDIKPRIRGLVRIGERRWDLALNRQQRIMLPAKNPVEALSDFMDMAQRHDLLGREVTVIDLRNGQYPALRVASEVRDEIREGRGLKPLK